MIIYLTEPQEISVEATNLLAQAGHTLIVSLKDLDGKAVEALFIRTYTKVDQAYLANFPRLKYVIRAGTGTDNIDSAACANRQIKIVNSPGANALSVAEYSLSMMLTLIKKVSYQERGLRRGIWRDRSHLGGELSRKTVGLVGCGSVGKELARLLAPFQVKLLGYDKYLDPNSFSQLHIHSVSLPELLEMADVISVQIPLTDETRDLFDAKEFALMRSSCIFINVSRGELINESALIAALTNGSLAGAAIDVARGEPNLNSRLLALPNLHVTPHIAGFTAEADKKIALVAAQNFLQALEDNQ